MEFRKMLYGATIVAGVAGLYVNAKNASKAALNEYNENLMLANSIPAMESAHDYHNSKDTENKLWSYVSMARKDDLSYVSKEDLDVLENILNSNNTLGSRRGSR